MILRDLAEDYDLPFLNKLSRYGVWQKNYPDVICGLKRGFSYYQHKKGESFSSDKNHSSELLVAASENDQNSDTNWLRSDVDHFLVNKAIEAGVFFFDQTHIQKISRDPQKERWSIFLESNEEIKKVDSAWIIDASGSPQFSSKFLNTQSHSSGFKTHSSAIYTHFEKVDHWLDDLKLKGLKTSDYPYNPDFSALHHLIEEGWIWMLRFNNNRLSAGMLLDESAQKKYSDKNPEESWKAIIQQYPSLQNLFNGAEIAKSPNQFIKTGRLQRKLNKLHGNGWVVLPHTAGFVDPLHSTGIAYTLSGVEGLLKLFVPTTNKTVRNKLLKRYEDKLYNELSIIDLLVSLCYKSREHFDLFTACTMLYFIASIRYEQKRLAGETPDTFLCAGHPEIRKIIEDSFDQIQQLNLNTLSESQINQEIEKIRKRIEPFNSVGLLNPELNNMYQHTAVEL
jgi:FADH2 O2-dependent halogenase